MKANGLTVARLARVQTFMRMVMSIRGSTQMANRTVLARISGRMALHTQANSGMESRMVMANGRKMGARTVICMKANSGMI